MKSITKMFEKVLDSTMHRTMKNDLHNYGFTAELKAQLSCMANTYVGKYKISKKTLEQYKVLKKLQQNSDIIITRPDKGFGVVILNKIGLPQHDV